MQIKRLDTQAVVTLPDSIYEQEEFNWSPLRSNAKRALDGTLIVQQSTVTNGKPIALSSPPDMGWVSRSTVNTLKIWADIKGLSLELTQNVNGSSLTRTVIFDTTQTAVSAVPVEGIHSPDINDPFLVTLNFLTV